MHVENPYAFMSRSSSIPTISRHTKRKTTSSISTTSSIPPQVHLQHWVFSGFMMVGYILGTGALVLPSAMASLGYVVGMVVCVMFALLSIYVGIILGRTRNNFYPECRSYKMLARACVGPRFELSLEYLTCLNWFMTMALYVLTAVKAFQSAFYWTHICGYYWGLGVVAVMVPFMFIQNMKEMEWLAALSDGAAIIILVMTLVLLTQGSDTPSDHVHHVWPPHENFLDAYNPVSSFVFAYQGQSIFLEIMAEMKEPGKWPQSVYLSHTIMGTSYAITALVGYYFKGSDVPAFLPDGIENGPGKIVVNLLVAYHVLVAYIINNVTLCDMLKRRYFTGAETPLYKHVSLGCALLLAAYLLTNIIPFFEDMVNIIGAMCGSPMMIGLPPLFYFFALRAKGEPMGRSSSSLISPSGM
uniref:Amino acid transporter transmembrane domain-containing protein n=1 Tax=Lotharella globosa TaxID=91324 RepID=A0A7S4DVL7_9EUKA